MRSIKKLESIGLIRCNDVYKCDTCEDPKGVIFKVVTKKYKTVYFHTCRKCASENIKHYTKYKDVMEGSE